MTVWESHLLLTFPLVVFVVGGVWLWQLMDGWLAAAVDGDE